jgi:GT2 family glycosyltransferase
MIGTIIVNYKTDDRVIKYVTEEILKISAKNKIVIVNNSATDVSNRTIAEGCRGCVVCNTGTIDYESDVFVLGSKDNLGFARGNNLGAEFLLKHFQPDFLLISNSDLLFTDSDVIDKLLAKIKDTPDIGLICPRVLSPAGERQSPPNELPFWKQEIFFKLFYPFFALYLFCKQRPLYSFYADDIEGDIDLFNGSMYVVRTSAFVKAGMFDPNTFLYSEEPILATRIRRAGFRVYYYNAVSVVHVHREPEQAFTRSPANARHRYDSNRYYQKKYKQVGFFKLLMFDLTYFVFQYIWKPLRVNLATSTIIKRKKQCNRHCGNQKNENHIK